MSILGMASKAKMAEDLEVVWESIEMSRAETHRIYDLEKILETSVFSRTCKFGY